MDADQAQIDSGKRANRRTVSTECHYLPNVDQRTSAARRYRDLAMAYADELGGEAKLSEVDKALVRQAAALVVRSEEMQGALIRGDGINDEQLTRLTNAATRALQALRRKAKPKADAPDLDTYLASRPAA